MTFKIGILNYNEPPDYKGLKMQDLHIIISRVISLLSNALPGIKVMKSHQKGDHKTKIVPSPIHACKFLRNPLRNHSPRPWAPDKDDHCRGFPAGRPPTVALYP